MLGALAGAVGVLDWLDAPHAAPPAAGVAELVPLPHELVEPGSVDDGPQAPALLAAGALPQPDGSVGELADPDGRRRRPAAEPAAHVLVESVDDVLAGLDDAVSRFRKAVTSLPVGTMAMTSQPSPDFSVSLAASVDASKLETLTESNSDMARTITTGPFTWW